MFIAVVKCDNPDEYYSLLLKGEQILTTNPKEKLYKFCFLNKVLTDCVKNLHQNGVEP